MLDIFLAMVGFVHIYHILYVLDPDPPYSYVSIRIQIRLL